MSDTALRWFMALCGTALYLLMCGLLWWRARQQRICRSAESASLLVPGRQSYPVLVAYASQTGNGEQLAQQTARALHTAGLATKLLSFARLDAVSLQSAQAALFIVSTYGEGDAPDSAAHFAATVMTRPMTLRGLRYGLLALGDRQYAHFCGFGQSLASWLTAQGARPLFDTVEVDNHDSNAVRQWQHCLGHLAGTIDTPDWEGPAFQPWTLLRRQHLNPGSAGAPAWHLELLPPAGVAAVWQAGDLVQVQVPADPDRPREYSIGSLPGDGSVHLLVRVERHDDGSHGLASGLLCEQLPPGGSIAARLRSHGNFRIGENTARDLILIGNGTGLSGLRSHLKARAAARTAARGGPSHWLIFGERNAAFDGLYAAELSNWERTGLLSRVDLVYSRDGAQLRYVQDRMRHETVRLRTWVADGAAIYVCGSLQGMATGVDAALKEILGEQQLLQLSQQGRYRRDVY